MSRPNQRVFPRELKLELCRQIVAGKVSQASVMRTHRLGSGTLERWLFQYRIRGEEAFDGQRWRAVEDEEETVLGELRKENERLRKEVEFLQQCLGKLPPPRLKG